MHSIYNLKHSKYKAIPLSLMRFKPLTNYYDLKMPIKAEDKLTIKLSHA
jgi:hypothetical protein